MKEGSGPKLCGAPPPGVSRRAFLETAAAAAPGLWLGAAAAGCSSAGAVGSPLPDDPGLDPHFRLTEPQMTTLRAVVDRLMPADDTPGALAAGAAECIANEWRSYYFANSREAAAGGLDAIDDLARRETGRSFAEASPEQRDELLRAFQSGEQTIRGVNGGRMVEFFLSMTLEGFLCHPVYGGNRDEAGWEVLGIHACGPQPRRDTLHRRPSDHPSRAVDHTRTQFDAIVVGSGAGGGPVAQILSEAGMEVLVIEKGPWYTKRDFLHDEVAMSRRDFFIPSPDVEPHIIVEGSGRPRSTKEGWTSRCVGGGTVHMSGFFLRLHPEDFRMRSILGDIEGARIADWPISYEDLAPHYRWVERTIGVSGEYGPGQVGDPYPLPPLVSHPWASFVDEGARRIGVHTFQTPRAVLSRNYGGRPTCNYCGFCGSYGCENDSKSSSLATYIPNALATGRCTIRPMCMVQEVLIDDQQRATGVRYVDADSRDHEVRARIVVLACSAVETARLLLHTTPGRFTHGLANSSGLVGQNLIMSTFAGGEGWIPRTGASPALATALDSRHPFLQRTTQDFYWLHDAGGRYHPKGGSIVFLAPHPNPIHTAEHVAQSARSLSWGQDLKDRLRRHYFRGRVMEFECFGEFLPTPSTNVTLDPQARDWLGMPSARIALNPHAADREMVMSLLRKGLRVLESAGCTATRGVDIGKITEILQGGTCRFGTNPAEAVLNPDCQAFDIRNLFVTDGSFMPTSGAVPITLTIMANASRVARRIVEMSQRHELA
jgi:choline dehydrogenase-like flavoprotein